MYTAEAVAAAVEGLDEARGGGITGAITVVSVSDPAGAHAPPGATAADPPARGVLVFPSTMVPRPERLLLDRAEPVAIRDLEGVRLIHLVDSDTLVQRLNVRPGTRRTDFERTTGPGTGFRSLRVPRQIGESGFFSGGRQRTPGIRSGAGGRPRWAGGV